MEKTGVKSKLGFLCSQYTAGAVVLLTAVTNGALSGWGTACLALLKSKDSPIEMDVHQLSWVMSVQFFGHMLSAIPAGILTDRYGAKIILGALCMLLAVPSFILLYLADDWKTLAVARFLGGAWVGIVGTVVPLYLSEISKPNVRGFLITMYSVSFRIGNIYALVLALFVSYKSLPLFYSVALIAFISIFPFVPESPHYYLKRDDKVSAKKSIVWLRKYNDVKIDKELNDLDVSVRKEMENKGSFIDLISTPGNRKALLIVEVLAILQKLCGLSSIINYLSITLPKSMLVEPAILVIIIELLRFIGALMASLIIDRTGSKILILSTSSFCGFMMLITGSWFYFNAKTTIDVSSYSWIPFVCITLHSISYSIGLNSVCNNIRAELFSLNVKGKCSAITCTITALFSFLVSKMYLIIDHKFGMYVNFFIYAVSGFLITLFTTQVFIETKGKTLQEIQDELNNKDNLNA